MLFDGLKNSVIKRNKKIKECYLGKKINSKL